MKTAVHIILVVVTGSLLGTVFGKIASLWFPQGQAASIMATSINTGLNPVTVDLSVIQFTFGLIFKFDIMTVIGVFVSATIYKHLLK